MNKELGKHYDYSFKGIKLDPYRILSVYKIVEPEQQHAIKKLLRAGKSVKGLEQDIDEVIMTLQRWKERIEEDRGIIDKEPFLKGGRIPLINAGLIEPPHYKLCGADGA